MRKRTAGEGSPPRDTVEEIFDLRTQVALIAVRCLASQAAALEAESRRAPEQDRPAIQDRLQRVLTTLRAFASSLPPHLRAVLGPLAPPSPRPQIPEQQPL